MTTCSRCHATARWRDANGCTVCGSHVPANGRPLARLPAPLEPDIVARLNRQALLIGLTRSDMDLKSICEDAAAEIRRLRALVRSDG